MAPAEDDPADNDSFRMMANGRETLSEHDAMEKDLKRENLVNLFLRGTEVD